MTERLPRPRVRASSAATRAASTKPTYLLYTGSPVCLKSHCQSSLLGCAGVRRLPRGRGG